MITKSSLADQTLAIAASALKTQQARMRIISENIANSDSTGRTPGEDPYRRQIPVFSAEKLPAGLGVRLQEVRPDNSAFSLEYDPSHPAADAKGYVKRSNVNSLVEAMDMKEASRAYEANLKVIENARAITMRTIDILNK
jgi:flagellar basal-body rod protein FlgC